MTFFPFLYDFSMLFLFFPLFLHFGGGCGGTGNLGSAGWYGLFDFFGRIVGCRSIRCSVLQNCSFLFPALECLHSYWQSPM